jgi:hypothetical protein
MIQRYTLEFAVGGDGDEAQQGREDDVRESPGIAGDDLACGLSLSKGGRNTGKSLLALGARPCESEPNPRSC